MMLLGMVYLQAAYLQNVPMARTEFSKDGGNDNGRDGVWISHSTFEFNDVYGFSGEMTSYSYAQRFTTTYLTPYVGRYITKIRAIIGAEITCTIRVWTGTANGLTLIHEQPVIVNPYVITEVELTTPIPITGTDEIWIGYGTLMVPKETYFMGVDSGPYVDNVNYVIDGNTPYELKKNLDLPHNLLIAGFVGYPDGVDEIEDKINLKIYPNPANDMLNVEGNDLKTIEIYNYMGQRFDVINAAEKLDISTSAYESGVYFVKVITKDDTSITKKVIIVH